MPKKPKSINLEQTDQHGCSELLEVVLFAPQGATEQDFMLGADVRFGTMLVSSEDWSKSIEIGLSRATLNLELDGCAIDPAAQRLGDQKPISAKTHVQRTQTANTTAHVSAKASASAHARASSVGSAEAGAAVGFGRDMKVSSIATQVTDTREEPVVALSGNRWRFSAVSPFGLCGFSLIIGPHERHALS
jgi:hypothetical protein